MQFFLANISKQVCHTCKVYINIYPCNVTNIITALPNTADTCTRIATSCQSRKIKKKNRIVLTNILFATIFTTGKITSILKQSLLYIEIKTSNQSIYNNLYNDRFFFS